MPQVVQVKKPLPTTDQKMVESAPALLPNTDPSDGRVSGPEAYFAGVALNELIEFWENFRYQNKSHWVMLRFAAGLGTADGIQLSPPDTLLLKEAMKAYLAYLRQGKRNPCTSFLLQSALYLYGELQQAPDKGLYASMYTQKFSPVKAREEAQAWLRDHGYLEPKENIETLTLGNVLHFVAPAKGKPMLILYADQANDIKDVQQGIYDGFLRWYGSNVRHVLLEGARSGPIDSVKEIFCEEDLKIAPLMLYCAADHVAMYRVEDSRIFRQDSGCYTSYSPQIADTNRRNQTVADNIEKATDFLRQKITLMSAGAASVQYLIDELPKRGLGLVLIEPHAIHRYIKRIEMLPRLREKSRRCNKDLEWCKWLNRQVEDVIKRTERRRLRP